MKSNRTVGGVLLVAGTTIGAAILALPTTTGFMGFFPSMPLLLGCFVVMLFTSVAYMDVSLSIPGENSITTMAEKTLGLKGKALAWSAYLLLLYLVEAAYLDGCSSVFIELQSLVGSNGFSRGFYIFAIPLVLGFFLFRGAVLIDMVNRFMMLGLALSYVILIYEMPAYIKTENLTHVDWTPTFFAIPVILVAFGNQIIIPSLTQFCKRDRSAILKSIVIGSFIPLVINVAFQFLSLGVLPLKGTYSITGAYVNQDSVTGHIASLIASTSIRMAARLFSFFAIITSFIGVSLSLFDFFKDALHLKKDTRGKTTGFVLTFLPPILLLSLIGKSFNTVLQFAGAFVALLLIFLPCAMAWNLKTVPFYSSLKGRGLLLFVMILSVGCFVLSILHGLGQLDYLISAYR